MKRLVLSILAAVLAALISSCLVPAPEEVGVGDEAPMAGEEWIDGPANLQPVAWCLLRQADQSVAIGRPFKGGCCVGCLKNGQCWPGTSVNYCGVGGFDCVSCVPLDNHGGCFVKSCAQGVTCDGFYKPKGAACHAPGWACNDTGHCCPLPGQPGTCF